jgi:hypothetical protein
MSVFTLSQCWFREFSVRNVYVCVSGFLCLISSARFENFFAVAVVVKAVTWNQAESDEGWDAL